MNLDPDIASVDWTSKSGGHSAACLSSPGGDGLRADPSVGVGDGAEAPTYPA